MLKLPIIQDQFTTSSLHCSHLVGKDISRQYECLTNSIAMAPHKFKPQCLLGFGKRAHLDFLCWLMTFYCQQTMNKIVNAICWAQYNILTHWPDVFVTRKIRHWDPYKPFIILGSSLIPRSEELRTQKLKSHLVRTQSLKVFPLKHGVGQYIAIYATLTVRDFFLACFYPSGPLTCIFSKIFPNFSCVGCG